MGWTGTDSNALRWVALWSARFVFRGREGHAQPNANAPTDWRNRDRVGISRRGAESAESYLPLRSLRLCVKSLGGLRMLSRRDFLNSSSLLALAPAVPWFIARTARAAFTDKGRRVLVIIQLDGGNDALNTVVPHSDPNYEKLRPKLKIAKKRLLPVSDSLGLHPSLKPLDPLLQAGHLAVIPGVGYPNPNRSHFESMAI